MKYKQINISLAIILLIILGQIVRVTIFQRRRDPNAFASVDETALVGILFVIAGCVFIALSKIGQVAVRRIFEKSNLKYFIYYYFFCAFSALWSTRPEYTLFRAVEMIVNIILLYAAFMIIQQKDKACRILLFIIGFSTFCGIAYYWKIRGGIFLTDLHTNTFTVTAGIGFLLSVGFLMHSQLITKKETIFCTLFFAVALFAGTSSASLVSTAIGLIVLNMLKKKGNLSFVKIVAVICIILSIYNFALIPAKQILFPGKSDKAIMTMTGRTGFWEIYIDGYLQKPILGWGFPTGEKEADRFGFGVTSSSHNGFISVAINTGTVGLGLFFFALVKTGVAYMRSLKIGVRGTTILVSAVIVGLVNNNSYPVIGSHWFWPSTAFLALLAFSEHFLWGHKFAGSKSQSSLVRGIKRSIKPIQVRDHNA